MADRRLLIVVLVLLSIDVVLNVCQTAAMATAAYYVASSWPQLSDLFNRISSLVTTLTSTLLLAAVKR
jgi:hypothetical protein